MLLDGNKLPARTYKLKDVVHPLGLELPSARIIHIRYC
jgi:hypothetical protein